MLSASSSSLLLACSARQRLTFLPSSSLAAATTFGCGIPVSLPRVVLCTPYTCRARLELDWLQVTEQGLTPPPSPAHAGLVDRLAAQLGRLRLVQLHRHDVRADVPEHDLVRERLFRRPRHGLVVDQGVHDQPALRRLVVLRAVAARVVRHDRDGQCRGGLQWQDLARDSSSCVPFSPSFSHSLLLRTL